MQLRSVLNRQSIKLKIDSALWGAAVCLKATILVGLYYYLDN